MDVIEMAKLLQDASEKSHSIGAKDWITFIGIILTFSVSLFAAVKTYKIWKNTPFINTVTASRVKWIDTLRINISTFTGTLHSVAWAEKLTEAQQHEMFLKLNCLVDQIKLSLNVEGEMEKNIINLLDKLPGEISNTESVRADLDSLISYTQRLLKEEWEVVKQESGVEDFNANFWGDLVIKVKTWYKIRTGC